MKATVTSITGFYGAFVSMFMSKRTWTPELDKEIKEVCDSVLDNNGRLREEQDSENLEKFNKWLGMLLRMGKKHITVLRKLMGLFQDEMFIQNCMQYDNISLIKYVCEQLEEG